MSATMTPKCRKATVEELMKWAQASHPRPQYFLTYLARATDEELWNLVCHIDNLKQITQCVSYDKPA